MLDSLIVIVLVGLVAGFLASHLVSGHGYGVIGDVVVGVVGALFGTWLASHLGIAVTDLFAEIVVAFIGAAILLAVLRLVTGSRHSGAGRRRRIF
jgi:uncharacterized membrane protein YeaQ/YmgE (transglycosylase-associated protein family)